MYSVAQSNLVIWRLHLSNCEGGVGLQSHIRDQEQSKLTTVCEKAQPVSRSAQYDNYIAESQERLPKVNYNYKGSCASLRKLGLFVLQDLEWDNRRSSVGIPENLYSNVSMIPARATICFKNGAGNQGNGVVIQFRICFKGKFRICNKIGT
ncbi:hypothetical protein BDQ17DRAFT_1336311 [Cyathus striatus]|nr:hypothetical protein BDQ17DRAFT_1336311 [Cyathus striatus]